MIEDILNGPPQIYCAKVDGKLDVGSGLALDVDSMRRGFLHNTRNVSVMCRDETCDCLDKAWAQYAGDAEIVLCHVVEVVE